MDPLLRDACQLRLDRADEHLATLDHARSAILNDIHSRVVIDLEPKEPEPGDRVCAIARVSEPPPLSLGVTVGEFGHNLRSILDYIVNDLVDHRGNTVTDQTAFVIADTKDIWKRRSKANLRGLTADDIEVVKGVQPYLRSNPATDDPLSRLGWLSNRDKHRLFHASYLRQPVRGKIAGLRWGWVVSSDVDFDQRSLGTHSQGDRGELEAAWGTVTRANPQVRSEDNLPVEVSLTDTERALFLDDLRVIRVEVEAVAQSLLNRF